ncbi:MAG: PAS domain S-box protein [Pirellulales bacterium]
MKDKSAGKKRGSPRGKQQNKSSKDGDAATPLRSRPRRAKPGTGEQIKQEEIHDVLNSLAAGVFKVFKDGRIVYANAQGRRLLDMPDRDPVGMSLREFEPFTIWPDGSPLGYDDYPAIKCLRTGELQSGTVLGLRLPGDRLLWITVSAVPMLDPKTGVPESAIVTIVDSSQPKHVEDSLRESEERYRRLVEHAPDAIIVHRKGSILFVNDAGVRLYGGRSRDDFIGRNVLDLVPPKLQAQVRRRIRLAMSGQVTPLTVQRHIRLDGRPVYVEVTGSSCMYLGQRSVQVICRDVTRRRRAERDLRRAKAELEERVQMRTEELTKTNAELRRKHRFMEQTLALGERDRKLVAYEIHDTILRDVIGSLMFLDAARENRGTENENAHRLDQARKLLRNCIDEARRMISGLRPLIIDEQGIAGAVDYLVNEFNGRGLDIRFTHAMQCERLAADLESAVFRIVQEALSNLERHSQSSKGQVTITDADGTLRVEIRDFGAGFDPEAVAEGHYGLEGIKQRARLAGGSATISSAKSQGTTVKVELPLDRGRAAKQAE